MKTKKIIAGMLVVLGFGGSCAYRGMKNYAPEEEPAPGLPGTLMPGVEVLRPTPVAYGTPPVMMKPTKDAPADSAKPETTAPAVGGDTHRPAGTSATNESPQAPDAPQAPATLEVPAAVVPPSHLAAPAPEDSPAPAENAPAGSESATDSIDGKQSL